MKLRQGRSGSFEITVDGQLAFSKQRTGRFPTEADLAKSVG